MASNPDLRLQLADQKSQSSASIASRSERSHTDGWTTALIELQRTAGNAAVVQFLIAVDSRPLRGSRIPIDKMLAVQKCGPVPCNCEGQDQTTVRQTEEISRDKTAVQCINHSGPGVHPGTGTSARDESTMLQRQGPAPASLTPPGDCTTSEHAALQAEVDRACDRDRRCRAAGPDMDDCPSMLAKIQANQECIKARVKINTRCFRGGDPGHNEAVANAVNSLINCWLIYNRKCVPQPVPVPVPERERTPTARPAVDRSFMERMAAITGLTGGALIIYLILSEGSRLFPPRNLIPIP